MACAWGKGFISNIRVLQYFKVDYLNLFHVLAGNNIQTLKRKLENGAWITIRCSHAMTFMQIINEYNYFN